MGRQTRRYRRRNQRHHYRRGRDVPIELTLAERPTDHEEFPGCPRPIWLTVVEPKSCARDFRRCLEMHGLGVVGMVQPDHRNASRVRLVDRLTGSRPTTPAP